MKQGVCIAVHGGDHKAGTTMLTTCIAEHISEYLENDLVIEAGLHGNPGGDYCTTVTKNVEEIRSYLEQDLLNGAELLRECKVQDRRYLLRGIIHPEQQRLYHPRMAAHLLTQLKQEVSFIIADTGSEVDNGLAIGAMQAADLRCLVLTQQESVLAHWERNQTIYRRLSIDFHFLVINRYLPEAVYTKEYLSERLGFPMDRILTVSDSPFGMRADNEKKSLLQYKDERLRQNIRTVCERLTEQCGVDYPREKRWKFWKNSI
ncbi:MAG: hypothetical protein IJ486_03885 [Firmicutes bacterium]|nr:hypothetical protein [Bacillota bacterium]